MDDHTRSCTIFSHGCIVMWLHFFVVVHYVSGYCNNFYSTTDGCVFQCFIYHYNSYDGFSQGLSSFSSVRCGSGPAYAAGHKRCWSCCCTSTATSISDAFLGICQLCPGSLQVSFSFRGEPPTDLSIYIGICYGRYFLFSGSTVDAISPMEA